MTEYPQFCAIARATEILGERWTLLILRELHLGPKRYSDLLERLAPIAPGVLNARLKSLEATGVIARRTVAPPTPARLIELTEAGRALEPVLFELLRWGARYLLPERPGERFEPDWLRMVFAAYVKPGPLTETALAVRTSTQAEGQAVWLRGGAAGLSVSLSGESADATITAPVTTLLGLMSHQLRVRNAVADGRIAVEGDLAAAEVFETFFVGG